MRRKGAKRARRIEPASESGEAGPDAAEPETRNPEPATRNTKPGTAISQYVFTFELIKQYPTLRSFIVKQPLKRSFNDTLSELFGGSKKGAYKL